MANSSIIKDHNELWKEQRIRFQENAVRTIIWQTCINCIHFNQNEGCDISGGAKPPANIIVNGCMQHSEDIPF